MNPILSRLERLSPSQKIIYSGLIVILILFLLAPRFISGPGENVYVASETLDQGHYLLEEEIIEPSEAITEDIIVDIKGEITKPGIYKMKEGDRIDDVIRLAGGFTQNANPRLVNLAERVKDEMVIFVFSVEETENSDLDYTSIDFGTINKEDNVDTDLINLNEANETELIQLPGIGPAKASAIAAYRDEHGAFQEVDELKNVPGIGDKTLENLRSHLTIN